jgi:hypothetical protein
MFFWQLSALVQETKQKKRQIQEESRNSGPRREAADPRLELGYHSGNGGPGGPLSFPPGRIARGGATVLALGSIDPDDFVQTLVSYRDQSDKMIH